MRQRLSWFATPLVLLLATPVRARSQSIGVGKWVAIGSISLVGAVWVYSAIEERRLASGAKLTSESEILATLGKPTYSQVRSNGRLPFEPQDSMCRAKQPEKWLVYKSRLGLSLVFFLSSDGRVVCSERGSVAGFGRLLA
jgi:hypothetical protein